MYRKFQEPVLTQPIAELNFSVSFKLTCELAGFNSLSELLGRHTRELLKLPGFTCHMLEEYIAFLESEKVAHYLDAE